MPWCTKCNHSNWWWPECLYPPESPGTSQWGSWEEGASGSYQCTNAGSFNYNSLEGSCASIRIPIVCKGVPAPSPFLRHPSLDPACPTFLKSLFPLPSFLFHPLLRCFRQFSPPLQPPSALIQPPTNLPWLKQISEGWFYQFNCRFLSKINL